ncbi:collectin-12-like [Montipora capricornis]|uniref:collectin-12-like n=1 Tax=Montipora capricornis TaxID=246305 RepID=UPI0035F1830A
MGDNCANRRALLGFRGFLTITAIGFAITLTFFVDETESARETKGLKSVKSNKEKCKVLKDDDGNFYLKCVNASEEKQDRMHKNRKTNKPGDNRKHSSQCSSECRGKRGQRGQRGKPGSKGEPGPSGPEGPPGEKGQGGLNGKPGLKGPIGPSGEPGLKGASGLQGGKGSQGPRGPTGIRGPPGLPGNCVKPSNTSTIIPVHCLPGKEGPKGPKGDQGKMGQRGPSGPRGSKGPRGIKGNAGLRGKKGDPGPPGNFVGLNCMPRYSNWVNKIKWLYEYPEVHCDRREFLQGLSLEENNSRGLLRFKYTCCALRLLHTP